MSRSIIYLGLDVHKESVTLAVLPADAPAPGASTYQRELMKSRHYVLKFRARPSGKALVRVQASRSF